MTLVRERGGLWRTLVHRRGWRSRGRSPRVSAERAPGHPRAGADDAREGTRRTLADARASLWMAFERPESARECRSRRDILVPRLRGARMTCGVSRDGAPEDGRVTA